MKIQILENGTKHEYSRITKIVIYGNGAKLYETNNGYFEEIKVDKNNKIQTVYDGRPVEITLTAEPKNARKENLNRKDNYLLSYRGKYSWQSGTALYIHDSEIAVENAGEHIAFQNCGETNYKNTVTLKFKTPARMDRRKIETVENAGSDFTPPEGCRWSNDYSRNPETPNYDVIHRGYFSDDDETRVVKRWIEIELVSEILVSADGYSHTEKDSAREYRETLAKSINEKKVFHKEVSHYEIENLLKYFDVTPKTTELKEDK